MHSALGMEERPVLRKISTKKYAYGRGVYALQEERAAAELGGVSVAEVVRQMKGWSGPRKRHEHNKAKKDGRNV